MQKTCKKTQTSSNQEIQIRIGLILSRPLCLAKYGSLFAVEFLLDKTGRFAQD